MSQRFRLRPVDAPATLRLPPKPSCGAFRSATEPGRARRPGESAGGDVAELRGPAHAPAGDGRKAATQARILRAAMALFAERGYERTTIAAVAAESGLSRAAVFWHFGDKATLFQETFKQLLVPFLEELERSFEGVEAGDRVLGLFSIYEAFVEKNRETIQNFVRWVMESPALRESLQTQLFALHDHFARDVRQALDEALEGRPDAAALAAGLVSQLDGNLLLSFLDPDPEARRVRREGLRAMTGLLLGREPGR